MQNERQSTNCDLLVEKAEQFAQKLPHLVDRRTAHALVEKVFDACGLIELDPETKPFVREPVSAIDGYERFVDGADADSDAPSLTGYVIKNA